MDSRMYKIRRRRKRKGRIIAAFIVFIILISGTVFGLDILKSAMIASDKIYQPFGKGGDTIKISDDPFNLLLVGVESQEGGKRADTLMLVTVNPKTEKVYLTSIPRDYRIYLPMQDRKDKINHSYGDYGIDGTARAIEEMLEIEINYYVTTNFDGFEQVVDTLGGIKVDVPFEFSAMLTGERNSNGKYEYKTFTEGEMELNGREALAYVRMRKSDPRGDVGRNERQQQVIKAILNKGTSFSSLTKIDDLISNLGDNVTTNIRPTKFLEFGKLYDKLKKQEIQTLRLKGENKIIDNTYYMIPDDESVDEVAESIAKILRGEEVIPEDAEQTEQTEQPVEEPMDTEQSYQ